VNELSLGFLLTLLAICLLLSAFFSGTETALMSINRYQLRTLARKGHRGALMAEKLLQRPDKLIGLILLGNNLANNLAATLVAVIVLQQFDDEWLAVGAGLLTLLMLIFCEVGPKTLGAIHPKPVALASAHIYRVLGWCLYPAVWIINRVTNGMLRLVGIKVDQQAQQTALTQEELRTVVAEAGVLIPQRHRQMLMSILDLERVTVDDIMIPRNEVVGIDLTDDWTAILEQLRDSQHTRLPVFEGELDRIIGVLHMKRVASELAHGKLTRESIREIAAQRGAERRVAAFQTKTRKDLSQATQLLEVLLSERPADLRAAWSAARKQPPAFVRQLRGGLKRLPAEMVKALKRVGVT